MSSSSKGTPGAILIKNDRLQGPMVEERLVKLIRERLDEGEEREVVIRDLLEQGEPPLAVHEAAIEAVEPEVSPPKKSIAVIIVAAVIVLLLVFLSIYVLLPEESGLKQAIDKHLGYRIIIQEVDETTIKENMSTDPGP